MTARSTEIDACRSCGARAPRPFLDLGVTPLADRMPTAAELAEPEPRFPLVVAFCERCALVQLTETVDPELLFTGAYPYHSSFSDTFVAHARAHALELCERRGLGTHSLVVELASNDGTLLANFVERGVPVLGIDPAPGPVAAARERGVETLEAFFGAELAQRLADEGRRADVVLGNNVLAHVADLNGFVAGVATLLADDGLGVFEFPYVRDLLEHVEFDTIYHEHLCYLSVVAVDALFRRHGLFLTDVRRLAIHGGSLRISVEKVERPGPGVGALLAEERALGMHTFAYHERFGERVRSLKHALRAELAARKAAGQRLAAYGAAAKGSTLLNVVGIGAETLDFVVDRNVHKHGRHMPGVHLPIRPVEALLEEQPDTVLLLAWNFADEIRGQQAEYVARGGRFLVPVPEPRELA